jgi:hypothetical protein
MLQHRTDVIGHGQPRVRVDGTRRGAMCASSPGVTTGNRNRGCSHLVAKPAWNLRSAGMLLARKHGSRLLRPLAELERYAESLPWEVDLRA